MAVVNIDESQVKEILNWPLVCEAVEQALRSICETRVSDDQPTSNQPTRIFTVPPNGKGALLTMPGFIGNYKLTKTGRGNEINTKVFNTLACKLVTAFAGNRLLNPPKPNIIGNIFLFSDLTGEMKAILAATEITAWRTAGASLVATEYLYLKRTTEEQQSSALNVAIVGCGVQGRIHALGLCSTYPVSAIRLWNRTKQRAEELAAELNASRHLFKNPDINISVADTPRECVKTADVLVTATSSDQPLVHRAMLKNNVHINAIGAGQTHNAELSPCIYNNATTKIYVDNWGSARTELKAVLSKVVGEVGDIINGAATAPSSGLTIFHSMGMAVEDAAVAQAVFEKHQNNL